MTRPLNFILTGIAAVAVILVSFGVGVCKGKRDAVNDVLVKTDTLTIRDTIRVERAVSVTTRVVDTMRVAVTDTLNVHDTTYVELEREQICWKDTLSTIYVSGFRPSVDSVFHYSTTKVVTKYVQTEKKVKSRWGVGVTAGYGVTADRLSPFVGVGVSYNILTW